MPNNTLPATIIAQFIKIWDQNSNYTDKIYDILNDKIQYFFDICYIVTIKQLQFHVLSTTLIKT